MPPLILSHGWQKRASGAPFGKVRYGNGFDMQGVRHLEGLGALPSSLVWQAARPLGFQRRVMPREPRSSRRAGFPAGTTSGIVARWNTPPLRRPDARA